MSPDRIPIKWLFAAIVVVCLAGSWIAHALDAFSNSDPSRDGAFFTRAVWTTAPSAEWRDYLWDQDEAEGDTSAQDSVDRPMFDGWSDPTFALFVTGRQDGYLEPCGCTGLDNAKGGLMRRHTVQKQLLARNWPLVSIDVGNQIRRFGMQPILKLTKTFEGLCQGMDYQMVGLGPDDLKIPSVDLLQAMENSKGDINPFTSANVTVLDESFTNRYRIVTAGGKTIGITAVFGDEWAKTIETDGIEIIPARQALGDVLPKLRQARCDLMVLVAFDSLENSRQLATEFPEFDVLITAGGAGEPTMFPEEIQVGDHTTRMIQVGVKGMYVGVVGFFDGQNPPIRYQRVTLDSRYEDSEQMKELFLSYQKQLETLGLEGLKIKEVGHPSERSYVGSDSCGECHTIAYGIWKNGVDYRDSNFDDGLPGPHWRATLDLTDPGERTWVQRHHDPECLSCHVTGWNPQNYYPYFSGYLKIEDTHLHGNGCENCHGPGSQHVAAENGDIDVTDEQLEAFRQEMVISLEDARQDKCIECHDLDNSPDFHHEGAFEKYWSKIEHIGKD